MSYIILFINAGETQERTEVARGESVQQVVDVIKSVNPDCEITSIREVKDKDFSTRAEAMNFAKAHRGYCEGPFVDENLDGRYIVTYCE